MPLMDRIRGMADRGLTPEERRQVLEDLFVFGKKNQAFKIRYTWMQKIRGEWPQQGQSIETFAERAQAGISQLTNESWQWELTQYGPDSSANPPAGDS